MAGTTEYLPVANGVGANVETQAQYVTDLGPGGALQNGYASGIVPSNRWNKSIRQSSMMAAGMANVVAQALSIDLADDGNLGALITYIQQAIAQLALDAVGPAVPTGLVGAYVGAAAPTGWVLCVGTIGNAVSGGTRRANADTEDLFTLLWNGWLDAQAPVSGGRGGSAAADFAANKTITVPDMRGRAIFGLDNLGGVAANRITNAASGIVGTTMGASGGSELLAQHLHAVNINSGGQSVDHTHAIDLFRQATGVGSGDLIGPPNTNVGSTLGSSNDHLHNVTGNTANAGTGNSANMPPAVVMSVIVKL